VRFPGVGELAADLLNVGWQEDVRLAGAFVARLADRRGGVVLDELLGDREPQDRLNDRERLAGRGGPDAASLQLLSEARQPLRSHLAHAVVTKAGQDVVGPGAEVEVPRGRREVRHGVQAPLRLHELAQRHVVRDGRLAELLAPALIGDEADGVALAIERPTAAAGSFAPTDLPASVRLSMHIHYGHRIALR
jgi:hypothetical protein